MRDVFLRATQALLVELFDGPPGQAAYVLNPGDPGLLRQLDGIDAAAASTRAMPGQTTVAAHTEHVWYALSLLNRWADGEANPWANADWETSWKKTQVDEAGWSDLRDRLRDAAKRWKLGLAQPRVWDDVTAAGAISSVAHTAYHLGSIRQILSASGAYKPVR